MLINTAIKAPGLIKRACLISFCVHFNSCPQFRRVKAKDEWIKGIIPPLGHGAVFWLHQSVPISILWRWVLKTPFFKPWRAQFVKIPHLISSWEYEIELAEFSTGGIKDWKRLHAGNKDINFSFIFKADRGQYPQRLRSYYLTQTEGGMPYVLGDKKDLEPVKEENNVKDNYPYTISRYLLKRNGKSSIFYLFVFSFYVTLLLSRVFYVICLFFRFLSHCCLATSVT